MAESKPNKVHLTAAQRLAKELQLRDQEKLQQIQYDGNLAKIENHVLKSELKHLQADRMRAQLIQQLSKSKSMTSKVMAQSMSQSMLNSQLSTGINQSQLRANHSPQPSMTETNPADSLPIIRRKGTAHHRRFVNEVRPRDYGLYLNSLHTLKDYRTAESENKHIKQKLFKEKYRQQMAGYRMFSQAAWQRVSEFGGDPVTLDEAKKFAKDDKKKIEESKKAIDAKAGEKKATESKPISEAKPAEKKPAEVKPAEVKPAEKKPADAKPAETKPADTKPAENKPDPKPADKKAPQQEF